MKISNPGPKKIWLGKNQQAITWLLNERYRGQLTKEAEKDIERLKKGEPIDYVIGHKDFLGCKIDLRYGPLIPREETELWVKDAILESATPDVAQLRDIGCRTKSAESRGLQILDIFAGSGCCGLAVLKHIPNSHCDFVDIDDSCLKQIRLNLKLNKIAPNRYRVIKSDIFEKLLKSDFNSNYFLVLANPPYIATTRKNRIQKSVLKYESSQALLAKENGLFCIKKFLKDAKQFLAPAGVIYLEFDSPQKKEIEQLLKKYGYSKYQFHRDQFNHWRYLTIHNP